MPASLTDFSNFVFGVLPLFTAVKGDKVGIQIESQRNLVTKVLTCLEVTDNVIEEALDLNCDCIVTFHPLIFSGINTFRTSNRVERCVASLIRNDIALLSVHTCFDSHYHGTNVDLAKRLGLNITGFIQPNEFDKNYGMGVLASTSKPMNLRDFAAQVSEMFHCFAKVTEGKSDSVESVAIVAGSGISFLSDVLTKKVDVFLTADVKYHSFHEAKEHVSIIDIGHYEMEQFVPAGLKDLLELNAKGTEHESIMFYASTTNTNPVYYIDNSTTN